MFPFINFNRWRKVHCIHCT